jgi:2C-methyl-D-erythritol 2,4-cyclodiphosphate synthase
MEDQIKNLVHNQNTINIFNEIKNRIGNNSYVNVPLSWVADTYFESCDKIKNAIDTNVLSQIPLYKQRLIHDTLQNITNLAQNILNLTYPNTTAPNPNPRANPQYQAQVNLYIGHYNNLTTNVIQLQNIVDDCRVYERMLGLKNYQEQLENLASLIQAYDDIVSKTEAVSTFFNSAQDNLNHIIATAKTGDEQINQINDFVKNGELNTIKVNDAVSSIEKNQNQIKEINQDVENRKMAIVAFHQNIDAYQKQIDKNIDDLDTFTEKTIKNYGDTIDKFQKRTETIVQNNEDYQKIIDTLLKGANAGKLNQTFDEKATAIEKYQFLWLVGLFVSTVSLVILVNVVINQMGERPSIMLFIARLSLALPFIFLDGFFIVQYNKRQSLIDEYRFKSAISLSLWSFDELLKGNKTDDVSKDFIINSIQKIYQSPFPQDDDFNKQQKELLGSFMKSVGTKVDKVADGVIDKVLK